MLTDFIHIRVHINFLKLVQVYGVSCHFQQYFCYFVAISFIGGGNQRKPLTCRKTLTNFITYVALSIPHHERGSNSQRQLEVLDLTSCLGSYNANCIHFCNSKRIKYIYQTLFHINFYKIFIKFFFNFFQYLISMFHLS